MPPIEEAFLTDTAILWEKEGQDSNNEPTFAEPEEIDVRWIIENRETTDTQGNSVITEVTVLASCDIPIGSLLWLGCLEEWYEAGSAGFITELMEVVVRKVTKDLKGRETRRRYGLMRYKNRP